MKLGRASIRGFSLPLHRPLATAHGAIEGRRGLLVEIEDEDGARGYGEATPLPDFGTEDLARCRATLEATLRDAIVGEGAPTRELDSGLRATSTPCADFALATARLDLEARRSGLSLAAWLHAEVGAADAGPAANVETQALVVGSSVEEVEANAEQARTAGYRAFKLKVGLGVSAGALDRDVERVAALRRSVGDDACLRLDANEAWDLETARTALHRFSRFDVDFVEQPVTRSDVEALAWLARNGALPVAADESLQGEGLLACLEIRAIGVLVVKPAALGTIARALTLAAWARDEGRRVVWSTLIDGAIGRSVALALAAATEHVSSAVSGVPSADREVHGLSTADLLAADLGIGAGTPTEGRLTPAPGPGIGFVPAISAEAQDHETSPIEVVP